MHFLIIILKKEEKRKFVQSPFAHTLVSILKGTECNKKKVSGDLNDQAGTSIFSYSC